MSILSLFLSLTQAWRAHSFAIMPVKRNSFLHFCLIIINIVVFFPILVLHFISSARCKCTWFHCSLSITKLLRILSLSLSIPSSLRFYWITNARFFRHFYSFSHCHSIAFYLIIYIFSPSSYWMHYFEARWISMLLVFLSPSLSISISLRFLVFVCAFYFLSISCDLHSIYTSYKIVFICSVFIFFSCAQCVHTANSGWLFHVSLACFCSRYSNANETNFFLS